LSSEGPLPPCPCLKQERITFGTALMANMFRSEVVKMTPVPKPQPNRPINPSLSTIPCKTSRRHSPSIDPFLTIGHTNAFLTPRASSRGSPSSVPTALGGVGSSALARPLSSATEANGNNPVQFSVELRPWLIHVFLCTPELFSHDPEILLICACAPHLQTMAQSTACEGRSHAIRGRESTVVSADVLGSASP
jgi:hypothetical protein